MSKWLLTDKRKAVITRLFCWWWPSSDESQYNKTHSEPCIFYSNFLMRVC